jgi:hypothetical protein
MTECIGLVLIQRCVTEVSSSAMSMQRQRGPSAALPGETSVFAVSVRPTDQPVTWSGGGDPATGTGRRFATAFASGGTYTVTARCGDARLDFPVTVCPVDEWLQAAGRFYGPAVDISRVTIKTGRLVLGPPRTAWTCNGVVRFKRPRSAEDLPGEGTLIHELAHVWQHQSGRVQLLKGLVEQTGRRLGRDPYDFGGPERLRTATHILEFSNESQAQIITEFWRSQHGYRQDRKGKPFSTPGYVDDLRRLVEGAGIGTQVMARHGVAWRIDSAAARLVNLLVDLAG